MKFKPEEYSICEPVKGICKSHGIWGMTGNTMYPLIYFRRPKWITDDKCWNQIVKSISLDLPSDIEIS